MAVKQEDIDLNKILDKAAGKKTSEAKKAPKVEPELASILDAAATGALKKKEGGEPSGDLPKDVSAGVSPGTTSTIPTTKWEDNPLNPVKSASDFENARDKTPEILFKAGDTEKLNSLLTKYRVPPSPTTQQTGRLSPLTPKPAMQVEYENASNLETSIKDQIKYLKEGRLEKREPKSNAEKDLENELVEVQNLKRKAATELAINGDKEVVVNRRTNEIGNSFNQFMNDIIKLNPPVKGTPVKTMKETEDQLMKMPTQFMTGVNMLKLTEPVEYERVTEAIAKGLPVSASQVAKITALGLNIEEAKLKRDMLKSPVTTAEKAKFEEVSKYLETIKPAIDTYEKMIKDKETLSKPQIADYQQKIDEYNKTVKQFKPLIEKVNAVEGDFAKRANNLLDVRRKNLIDNPEVLRSFIADGVATKLDELGKIKQGTAGSSQKMMSDFMLGHTWNYSPEQIKWASEQYLKEQGINPNLPQAQAAIKFLQENEGVMIGENSIAKAGGFRELGEGIIEPITGTAKSIKDRYRSFNDIYAESQSQGNVDVAKKRLASEDTGIRSVVNDVLKGTGQFASQAAIMYATSSGIGAIAESILGKSGVEWLAQAKAANIKPVVAFDDASANLAAGKFLYRIKDPMAVFTTSFAMSYDGNLKAALSYTSDNTLAKRAAIFNASMEGATELFLSPLEIAQGIIHKFSKNQTKDLLKILSDKSLKDEPGALKEYVGRFVRGVLGTSKVAGAEIGEEFVTQISDYVTNMYLNPDSDSFKNRDLKQELMTTAYQTGLTMAVPAILNGIGAMKANSFSKGSLMIAAQNRQKIVDGINKDLAAGKISPEQANEQIQLVNTAAVANAQLPKKANGAPLNTDEKANYIWSLTTEAYMDKKMASMNDAASKEIWKDKILKQQEYRKQILGLKDEQPEAPEYLIEGKPVGREEFLKAIEEKPDGNYVVTGDEEAQAALRKIGGIDDKTDSEVTSAVITIGGKTYEGKNHAEAILKAKADGKDISQVDRKRDGKFKLSDGTIIDRAEAKKQFGADRAEQLIEQDEAADNANKDYRKSDKDLVADVEEKGIKNYERTNIKELKEQALQAPASLKNQFDDEELVVDLIAKNTPEQIENAIKYQEERLTNDPNMDEVSMTGIDQHIQLLEKGLDKNKQFAELEKSALDKEELNKKREKYGLEPLRPTYRGTSQEEWESVQNGQPFKSKTGFGDNEANTTWVSDKKEYSDEYVKSNENGLLVEFKPEAIDKSGVESGQQGDDTGVRLGRNLKLEDVQRVTDKDGKVIYEAPKESKKPAQNISEQGKPLSKLENLKAKKKLAEVEVPGETVDEKLKHISDNPKGFAPELVALADKRFPKEAPAEETKIPITKEKGSIAETKPLTKEADDLLASIGEGSKPTFITKNLERIAKENGIEVTDKMSADDVINALKEKQTKGKDVVTEKPPPSTGLSRGDVGSKIKDGDTWKDVEDFEIIGRPSLEKKINSIGEAPNLEQIRGEDVAKQKKEHDDKMAIVDKVKGMSEKEYQQYYNETNPDNLPSHPLGLRGTKQATLAQFEGEFKPTDYEVSDAKKKHGEKILDAIGSIDNVTEHLTEKNQLTPEKQNALSNQRKKLEKQLNDIGIELYSPKKNAPLEIGKVKVVESDKSGSDNVVEVVRLGLVDKKTGQVIKEAEVITGKDPSLSSNIEPKTEQKPSTGLSRGDETGLNEDANKILGLHDNGVNFDLFDNNKLRQIAKDNGIDIPEGAKNADIIKALKEKQNTSKQQVQKSFEDLTEADIDKLTPAEKAKLYKENGITNEDGSEITEKDIQDNPLQYSYDFMASSNSGKWNSANSELEAAVQGNKKQYSLYKLMAGEFDTFKEFVDFINSKNYGDKIEYTERMRRADETMTSEERKSAIDSYNKSAEDRADDKAQKGKDILKEHGFEDETEYSPQEIINKFPLKGVQKVIFDIIKNVAEKLGIKVKFSAGRITEGFEGSNNPLNGEILISPHTLKNGRIGEVLVHEVVHALTTKIISRVNSGVETGLTSRQVAAVKGLNKLYEAVRSDNKLDNKYPVKDIFEFIAHLTNDNFVKELESKDRNFLQKVVDFIADILGISNANELAKRHLKDIISDGTFLEKEGITVKSSDYGANKQGSKLSPKEQLLEKIRNNSKELSEKYHSDKENDIKKIADKLFGSKPKDPSLSPNIEPKPTDVVGSEKPSENKPILNEGEAKTEVHKPTEVESTPKVESDKEQTKPKRITDTAIDKEIGLLSASFLEINQPESSRLKVVDVPISSISTDTSSFQNREEEYSQESVDKILKAVEEGRFDWTEFGPVVLWKNDGKLTMLSGHSRLEAFKRLSAKGNTEFETIPAQIFDGSKEQATAIALRSNTLATKETPIERANYYRDARLLGTSSKAIAAEAKEYEGRNAPTIISLSYLNPTGKAISDLKALGQEGDTKSKANSLQMARWVGEVRQQFPQLTNEHENEIYDWLKGGAYSKIKNLAEISSRINNVVSGFDFDSEKILNLEHRATKSYVDEQYEQQLEDKEKEIKAQQKVIADKATKYNEANLSPQEVAEKLVPDNAILSRMQQDYIKLKEKKGAISQANKGILSLFDNIQTEIDNGTLTENEANAFIDNTAEIEESDPIIEDIERNAESEITASQAIEEGIELINGENVIDNRKVKAEKKLAEKVSVLEKEKTARINEITKPELNMNTLLINDLFTMAATNEANRQEYEDIKSQFFSLKNLFDCLFA